MCSGILPFVILILINLFQTRMKKQLISVMVAASLLTACGGAPKTTAKAEKLINICEAAFAAVFYS